MSPEAVGATTKPGSSDAPTPSAGDAAPSPDKRMLGYVIGGVGVAGIGTALVLGGIALGKKSTVQDHCDRKGRTCDSPAGIDAASTGATLSTASTVTFVIGLAATSVGAYLILTSRGAPKTALAATPAPGGGYLRMVREF